MRNLDYLNSTSKLKKITKDARRLTKTLITISLLNILLLSANQLNGAEGSVITEQLKQAPIVFIKIRRNNYGTSGTETKKPATV